MWPHEEKNKCMQGCGRKERDHSKHQGVDGAIKLIDLSEIRLLWTEFI
jgi:hypothetical protein